MERGEGKRLRRNSCSSISFADPSIFHRDEPASRSALLVITTDGELDEKQGPLGFPWETGCEGGCLVIHFLFQRRVMLGRTTSTSTSALLPRLLLPLARPIFYPAAATRPSPGGIRCLCAATSSARSYRH